MEIGQLSWHSDDRVDVLHLIHSHYVQNTMILNYSVYGAVQRCYSYSIRDREIETLEPKTTVPQSSIDLLDSMYR